MSIPDSAIDAADPAFAGRVFAEIRARRVILALADNMPDDALAEAKRVFWGIMQTGDDNRAFKAAISAFLKHVGSQKQKKPPA